jgi:peptidase E
MTDPRLIVAMGGGGFSMDTEDTLLDDHVLSLARALRDSPRVCFLGTASGEADSYFTKFYAAFARRAEASHLALFVRTMVDIEVFLLDQDVIYVGGGNTASMLAVWRTHGVDRALRRAWEAGIVLTGLSAGSLCWFEGGTTDSFGPLAAFHGGLGFLPGSHSPHYDAEPERRPTYHDLIGRGVLPGGLAADDGAALVFRGTDLAEVVVARPAARGYRLAAGTVGGRDGAAGALPGLTAQRVAGVAVIGTHARRAGSHVPIGRTASAGSASLGVARRPCSPNPAGRALERGRPSARTKSRAAAEGCGTSSHRAATSGSAPASIDRAAAVRSTATRARPKTSRSRSSSRGPQRLRWRRPNSRSRCFSRSSRAMAPVAGSGPAGALIATTAFRNSGWSVTPTGAVA